jgi:hypothetical protein
VIPTLTLGVVAPAGLDTRIRHREGAQQTNWAPGLTLLLICNSTFIVMLPGPASTRRASTAGRRRPPEENRDSLDGFERG